MDTGAHDRGQVKPLRFDARLGAVYAGVFLITGVQLPYFPLWLEANGFSASDIAFVLAVATLVKVFAGPVISVVADHSRDRADVLSVTAFAAALSVALYFLPLGLAGVTGVSILFAVATSAHTPLADALTLSGVRRYGVDYARIRVWGSVAFLLMNLLAGALIQRIGHRVIIDLMFAGCLLLAGTSLLAPRIGKPRRPSPLSHIDLAEARRAMRNPAFVMILAGVGVTQASHAYLYGFSSIYWKDAGFPADATGVFWATGVVAEVVMFALFRRIFGATSAPMTLVIGSAMTVLRWIVFPLVVPLGLGFWGFIAEQTLHAFTFALTFLCLQKMISETVPEELGGTAQGLATFVLGVTMAAATFASGPLYSALGGRGFYVMAIPALAGAVLGLAAMKARPQARSAIPTASDRVGRPSTGHRSGRSRGHGPE
jgi:MFS transporter, PPP family, 3-phenylpropionic acid transporter